MNFLFRLFDIRQSETQAVGLLLLHAFFNGLGIALCFTAANLLFLQDFGAEALPGAYAISGGVLLVSGFIYSKLEHALSPAKLFRFVVVACATFMILGWLGFSLFDPVYMAFGLFVVYWVIYMLVNLEFWGVAALLFDVRQSKRLFALVGSGETVAKICGYLVSPLIVAAFSNNELVLVAGLGFGFSTIFIWKLTKLRAKDFDAGEHHDHHHQHDPMGIKAITGVLKHDRFLFWVSIMAMFGMVVYFTIKYAFLKRVEDSIHESAEMAKFFGLFFGAGKAVNFITKSVLAGRIMKRLGVKYLVVILPMVLLVINLTGVVGQFFGVEAEFFIWIFGFNMLFDEIARSSLLKPAFLVLFQPLHNHRKLQGHTISKGIMEPIGMALAGLLLLLISNTIGLDLRVVSVYLVLVIGLWLIVSLKVNSEFAKILQSALKRRWLGNNTLDIASGETRSLLFEKLYGDSPIDIVYALDILGTKGIKNLDVILRKALRSDNSHILRSVLHLIGEAQMEVLSDEVKELTDHEDIELAKKAIATYYILKEAQAVDELGYLVGHKNGEVSNAALASALKHGGIYGATLYGEKLLAYLQGNSQEQITAAQIVGEIGQYNYYHPILRLLESDDDRVLEAAIKAAGYTKNERLIPPLLSLFKTRKHYQALLKTFEQMGDVVFQIGIDLEEQPLRTKRFLLKVCAATKTAKAADFVFNYIDDEKTDLRRDSVFALFEMKHIPTADQKQTLEKMVVSCARTYGQLLLFSGQITPRDGLLFSAVQNEKELVRHNVFYLLSLLYDRETVIKIKDSMHAGEKDMLANSLERLEMLVPKRIRSFIMLIFDTTEEQNLLAKNGSKLGLKRDIKDSVALILNEELSVTEYLKAMVMFEFGEKGAHLIDEKNLLASTNSENPLLLEESIRCLVQYKPELINKIELGEGGGHKKELINHFKV